MGAIETTAAAAWKRDSFADAADYSVTLTDRDCDELRAALTRLRGDGRLAPAQALTRADFPFGALGSRLRAAYGDVRSGRGFVLLRGLPIDGLAADDFIAAVWGLGTWLGTPLSQNAQGDLVGHVLDATAQDATPRMYRSNLELRLHTDWTAMIVLACWQQAASGGASYLTSAQTVHDEIARRAPELLEPLYRGFHHHRLGEEGPGEDQVTPYRIPVFARHGGAISVRYQRSGIAAGHRALGVPLTGQELAAMDLFDEIAKAPEHRLAFFLERGDMLVINNYAVMHARTKFVEHPEPDRRRHLVRLWLDAEGFRDVPREVHLFAVNGVPPQPGRHCTFDFKQLYTDDPRATGGMPDAQLGETELGR
jgi:alpha-ketoglutarate-dependent taurine dioxygenase